MPYSYNFRYLLYHIGNGLKTLKARSSKHFQKCSSFLESYPEAYLKAFPIARSSFIHPSLRILRIAEHVLRLEKKKKFYEYNFNTKTNIFWPIILSDKNFSQSNICLQIVVAKWLFFNFLSSFWQISHFFAIEKLDSLNNILKIVCKKYMIIASCKLRCSK